MRNPTVATEGALTPRLLAILEQLDPGSARRVRRVLNRNRRTNFVAEVHLVDGRVLIVKQGRSDAARTRFMTAHAASTLLRGAAFETPSPRLLLDDQPVLAYWRIDRTTLHDAWQSAAITQHHGILQSCGALLQRLHTFQIRGVGSLSDPVCRSVNNRDYLRSDIETRLLPMLRSQLPQALRAATRLAAFAEYLPDTPSVVVHNDVFDQNVLCDDMTCTGLLDFEDAFAGPVEADFAKLELLHGPLFGQPWTGPWIDSIRAGYGRELDPVLTAAFRCHALLNMGWHGMTIGLSDHSRMLAGAAMAEAQLLENGVSHTEAVRVARLS